MVLGLTEKDHAEKEWRAAVAKVSAAGDALTDALLELRAVAVKYPEAGFVVPGKLNWLFITPPPTVMSEGTPYRTEIPNQSPFDGWRNFARARGWLE